MSGSRRSISVTLSALASRVIVSSFTFAALASMFANSRGDKLQPQRAHSAATQPLPVLAASCARIGAGARLVRHGQTGLPVRD